MVLNRDVMNSRWIVIVALLIFAFIGCEDIFEDDLSKEKVVLKSPSPNLVTSVTNISFSWDSLKNADMYNLQVVSKSFSNLSTIVIDTTVKKTLIRKVLTPGEYQWKVTAINSVSKAFSDTLSFTITLP